MHILRTRPEDQTGETRHGLTDHRLPIDGAVAVGLDVETQVGLPGTLLERVCPDPANSLRALVGVTQ
jgi:hypothetical protein